MKNVLKIHKKGIIVLPKWLRERIGVSENDHLVVRVEGGQIILTPLIPKRVKLGGRVGEIVKSVKREEMEFE